MNRGGGEEHGMVQCSMVALSKRGQTVGHSVHADAEAARRPLLRASCMHPSRLSITLSRGQWFVL